jgi:hypothetical protein
MKSYYLIKSVVILVMMTMYNTWGYSQVFDHTNCGFKEKHESIEETKAINCSNTSSDYIQKYRTPGYWKPSAPTSEKTILINFVICLKDDGTGGWADNQYTRDRLGYLVTQLNAIYGYIAPRAYQLTCPPVPDVHIIDSKIRFEINEVIFINNTYFHNLPATNSYPILDYLYLNYPGSKKALNQIYTLPPAGMGSPFLGLFSNYGQMPYVHTEQALSQSDPAYSIHHEHLIHEYGHALGLGHIYGSEITQINHFDFLDDVYGTCPEPYQMSCSGCTPASGNVCPFTCFYDQFPSGIVVPLMGGRSKNYYISPKTSGRMHRTLSMIENDYVVSSRYIHKCVKEKYSYVLPKEITVSETWDFAIKMYQDIVVKAGNTLTIKCKVYMPLSGKIIVEPGAKLVIDGGKVTCAHDGLWEGIQVWGDNTKNQYVTANGYSNQGWLELKNGAILEYAREAVVLFNPNLANKNGGVVQAKESTFRNNVRAAQFKSYRNFINGGNPSVPADQRGNFSYFENCNFETTQNLPASQTFNMFISMWDVTGIQIRGCNFTNSNASAPSISSLGTGIYALDANFSVTNTCATLQVPCAAQDIVRTQFNNLNIGIRAEKSVTNQPFTVSYSKFNNNVVGISNSGVSSANIILNEFIVGGNSKSNAGTIQIGVNLANVIQSLTLEGNAFKKTVTPASTGPNSFGTWAFNTGINENKIYRNSFENLHVGNLAAGVNKWITFDAATPGLQYNCNTNTGNTADFYVQAPPASEPNPQYHGIRPFQGVDASPAGNTFTPGAQSFFNLVPTPIAYYYGSTPQAFPTTSINTFPFPATGTNSCASTLGSSSRSALNNDDNGLMVDQQIRELYYEDKGVDLERHNQLLSSYRLPQAEYDIVINYIELKDWKKASEALNKIPVEYDLSGYLLDDYNNFALFANFCLEKLPTGELNQLPQSDVNELREIAKLGFHTGSQRAKSVLEFFYGDQFTNQPEFTLLQLNESLSSAKKETILLLYPNPTDDELTVKLQTKDEEVNGTILIVNPLNQIVFETTVLNSETVVNTRSLANGTYLVKYKNKQGMLATEKLIIQHK